MFKFFLKTVEIVLFIECILIICTHLSQLVPDPRSLLHLPGSVSFYVLNKDN